MKKIKLSLYTLLLISAVVSCKKEDMDIQPSLSFTEDRAVQNLKDLDQAVLGIYTAWGGENTMYINAILSDEVKLSNENRGQGQGEHKWTYSSANGGFAFGGYYGMILFANQTLDAATRVTAANSTQQATKDALVAEALALRAVAHFELLQRFGPTGYDPNGLGVGYIGATLTPSDKPSRGKVSETLAGIEADLNTAKAASGLPSAPPLNPSGLGNIRMSKAFIAGIQARVALYKKDWANASTFASEAITLSGKTLATGSGFSGIWTDANDNEVFLRLRRVGAGVGTLWQDTNGDVFFEPSNKLKQLYNRTTDIRFSSYFLIDPASSDTALVKKFYQSSRGPKIVDVKLMRVAEMYLIRAEAKAELNDLAGASADINALRAARIAGYTPITYIDKTAAINDIMDERFKELAFEGFRFFDLKRRGLGVSRPSNDVTSPLWQNLAAGDYKFALPIPQTEIFANPNSTQNPGY